MLAFLSGFALRLDADAERRWTELVICNDCDADLGERLLRSLRVAAVRLADVTQGQRHVLQGEVTARRRRRGESSQIEGGPDLLSI